ncbi:MAG TPA: ABC transporter permease [Gaiellaceae bacterium]|nr:ABC transporter permease [Gaiellaceae bacterium]
MASGETVTEQPRPRAGTTAAGRLRSGRRRHGGSAALIARVIGLTVSVGIAMLVFSIINSNFAKTGNLIEMIRSMSSLGLMALGLTLLIIVGELDLSVGATYGLAAMLMGKVWLSGVPFPVAFVIGLATGATVGLVNGGLTLVVGMPSFIATLATLNVAQGLTLWISNAQSIAPAFGNPAPPKWQLGWFSALGATILPFSIPIQVVWLIGLAIVVGFLLHRSLFGFRLFAIGGNLHAARTAKLPVTKYKLVTFVLCGTLAALAGILDFSFLGSTDPSAGSSLLFPVFAAVVIGGASLSGGRGLIVGTVLGALLLATLTNGLSIIGVGSYGQLIFVGAAIAGAVALDRWTAARSGGVRRLVGWRLRRDSV